MPANPNKDCTCGGGYCRQRHAWRAMDAAAPPDGEFPVGASRAPDALSRREFIKTLGAGMALAGLAGCGRRQPPESIVPYVRQPEDVLPGEPGHYATTFCWDGYGRGLVVEAHEGRPTKIEGNPDHDSSLGASDAVMQAAVLELYDPDRLKAPALEGRPSSWRAFDTSWETVRSALPGRGGEGLWLVTAPTTSPALIALIQGWLQALPGARWVQHDPLCEREHGRELWRFEEADFVLGAAADFLTEHPESLRYTRAFTSRRRREHLRGLNRFMAAEPTPTLTGAMADERLPAEPWQLPQILRAAALAAGLGEAPGVEDAPEPPAAVLRFARRAGEELRRAGARSLVVAGAAESPAVHRLCEWMNERLGSGGTTRTPVDAWRSDALSTARMRELIEAAEAGRATHVLFLGGDPLGKLPRESWESLARVPFSAALGLHRTATSEACRWRLPESHFLESWGDLVSFAGEASPLQPLVRPLYASRSVLETVAFLAGVDGDDHNIVREGWRARFTGADFGAAWHEALRSGVFNPESFRLQAQVPPAAPVPTVSRSMTMEALTLLVRPDAYLRDGRFANNAWLQELPRPISKLVWDNALYIAPALARDLRLADGDVVRVGWAGRTFFESPVCVLPGQASRTLTAHMGGGEDMLGAAAGGAGHGLGGLWWRAGWRADGVSIEKTGRRVRLVTTQQHHAMEGRDLVRVEGADGSRLSFGAGTAGAHGTDAPARGFYPPDPTGRAAESPYAWGMAIDLSTCIGCQACVAACQAENNIPAVGRRQVAAGREMHWIRVDRYFAGDPENPLILHQPVPCMHCEHAPCEVVCPVEATVHGPEGLNQMIYNRCIGTRYCSNNCPYKVRRFNFLAYNAKLDEPESLQRNPDVTVRERGVMEKCTYCVQRINRARARALNEERQIRPGELRTACQQACPADAIVFGNLKDPAWRVNDLKAEERNYSLLGHLRTIPRTTYLAKLVNLKEEA